MSTITGALLGAVATVIAGLVVNAIIEARKKRPVLAWFDILSERLPIDSGHLKSIQDLIDRSFTEKELVSSEAREILSEQLWSARFLSVINIENNGALPARSVSILFAGEPKTLCVFPAVGVTKETRENGLMSYNLDAIGPMSAQTVLFFGCITSDIRGVYFEGGAVTRECNARVTTYKRPMRYPYPMLLAMLIGGIFVGASLHQPSHPLNKLIFGQGAADAIGQPENSKETE